MKIQPNNRFPYSPIVDRPGFTWPGGKKLAVYVALCVEHFSYGGGGLPYSPGLKPPDSYNYGWREYGNRVGGWRLIDLFEKYKFPISVLLNSACYDHCPELVKAFSDRGDEIVAHGQTNSQHPNHLSKEEEAAIIEEVTAAVLKHEGKPPAGWMSPGAHPSAHTEDLLAAAGYKYTLDWPIDDQPVWMTTENGPLLSVPYPHEVNDVPMIVLHDGTGKAFADMAIDNFDELLINSQEQTLAFGITIHTFIVGQPFRIRQLRRVLDHLNAHSDDIWFTTSGEIARHYGDQFSPPASSEG